MRLASELKANAFRRAAPFALDTSEDMRGSPAMRFGWRNLPHAEARPLSPAEGAFWRIRSTTIHSTSRFLQKSQRRGDSKPFSQGKPAGCHRGSLEVQKTRKKSEPSRPFSERKGARGPNSGHRLSVVLQNPLHGERAKRTVESGVNFFGYAAPTRCV